MLHSHCCSPKKRWCCVPAASMHYPYALRSCCLIHWFSYLNIAGEFTTPSSRMREYRITASAWASPNGPAMLVIILLVVGGMNVIWYTLLKSTIFHHQIGLLTIFQTTSFRRWICSIWGDIMSNWVYRTPVYLSVFLQEQDCDWRKPKHKRRHRSTCIYSFNPQWAIPHFWICSRRYLRLVNSLSLSWVKLQCDMVVSMIETESSTGWLRYVKQSTYIWQHFWVGGFGSITQKLLKLKRVTWGSNHWLLRHGNGEIGDIDFGLKEDKGIVFVFQIL